MAATIIRDVSWRGRHSYKLFRPRTRPHARLILPRSREEILTGSVVQPPGQQYARSAPIVSSPRQAKLFYSPDGRQVLNDTNYDPEFQLDLDEVISRILVLAQIMVEKEYYPYQIALARRILESLLLHDGATLTSLMARQGGKTEVVGGTSAAASVVLPFLARKFPHDWRLNITDDRGTYRGFRDGLSIGIYAPKQEQSEITFERAKRAFNTTGGQKTLKDFKLKFEENNGNTLAISNGSCILCQSASPQSDIEGETHHLLLIEEAQDVSDLKIRKSLHPMVSSTRGTIVKIGTASTKKCDFYNTIKSNERAEVFNGVRQHFFFPWQVCAKYNSLYRKYVEGEKSKLGEFSDEFQMAYCGTWIFERGMFVTPKQLFNIRVVQKVGVWSNSHLRGLQHIPNLRAHSLVGAFDWGKSSDSTVFTLGAVDWNNPLDALEQEDESSPDGKKRFVFYRKHVLGWLEWQGDNYEAQIQEILPILTRLIPCRLSKLIMDSNACGSPIFDRFNAIFTPQGVEVSPFNFNAHLKSDGYRSLASDLETGRLTYPASDAVRSTAGFRRFIQQMLDLRKSWKGGIMQVSHPDEKGAHDDYPDSVMLFAWGCNTPAVTGRIFVSNVNPFYQED